MLRDLLLPFVERMHLLNIFQYISFRAAYAALTALFLSFVFGPGLISLLQRAKAGQEIRDDGPSTHLVKSGTPTMGGLLILFSISVAVLLWQNLWSLSTWVSIGGLLGFGLIGFIDDYLKVFRRSSAGLQARFKLVGQFAVAVVIVTVLYVNRHEYTTLLYIPFFKEPVLDLGVLYIPFGILLLVLLQMR